MTLKADPELASLYIHLYFDEDVSADIVGNIRTRGFDVLSARDADMLQASDSEQLLFAISQRRAIVTHNRQDFEERHRQFLAEGKKHFGIIVAKRRLRSTEVVTKLLDLLNAITAEDMEDQLRYV